MNYRYRYKVTDGDFDQLIDDLAAGRLGRRGAARMARWPGSARRSAPTGGPAPATLAQSEVDAR